ncbi:pilus assembly protein [Thalassotalea aquiviva]|uniref:pilus assembly protein n=1 Tax=Thalassotalea aquiviva TaxID=3242415 RepID=UPI00352A252A
MKRIIFRAQAFITLLLVISSVFAEDIELYVGNEVQRSATKPQVLIIFDNSGSMSTMETYEVDFTGTSALDDSDWIYYTHNPTNDMPTLGETRRRFRASKLGCYFSRDILKQQGTYTGKLRKYASGGRNTKWQELSNDGYANESSIDTVDCLDDIVNSIDANSSGYDVGYPTNDRSLKPYTTNESKIIENLFHKGRAYTLYTKEYLQFLQDNNVGLSRSRIDIAKETVTRLIESSPGVDYGLMVFNTDAGGRVVFDIADMSVNDGANKVDFLAKLNSLRAENWTPLCETLFEASQYFGGKNVYYGAKGGTQQPPSIQTSGNYTSPFANCSNEIYTIMITDGAPTQDTELNSWFANNLAGFDSSKRMYIDGAYNYLPALSHWMKTKDINPNIPGDQHSTFYTIGFGQRAIDEAGQLLYRAAINGGGQYYPATDATQLLTSLQSAILEILQLDTSFTAPSIASNNYDRTETLDSVYYAMFLPDKGSRWRGNLKKLKLVNDQQIDREGKLAIDIQGNIANNAKTFWSDNGNRSDGNDVKQGGVSEVLQNASNRRIFSDLGGNNALVPFTKSAAVSSYGSEAALALYMGLGADVAAIEDTLHWGMGFDIDDEDADDVILESRETIFGDPLHFKPLVINYGGSPTDQDVRIVVGTNSGALHMFEDEGDTVKENWAFMPKEFFPDYRLLRGSDSQTEKVYAIDGLATVHLQDKNGNGEINHLDGDIAWMFFGLRRGGSSFYALDVSDPDNPKFMWKIDANDSRFGFLGQSWSKMKIGYSKANIQSGVPRPTVFFSAGYDTNKDSAIVGIGDTVGMGMYMLDAQTGKLIWSLTPGLKTGTNTPFTGDDSIVASPALLDSDSDGMVDRVYLADTGGNLWRVDMPGADPFHLTTPWTYYKLASVGGDLQLEDRRFMSEPALARTYMDVTESLVVDDGLGNTQTQVIRYKKPFESILVGSGDRTNPQATDNQDRLFMFKDPNVITKSYLGDDRPSPIVMDDLYDYTDNPYGQTFTDLADKEALDIAVSASSGWYVDLVGTGEKSLAAPTVVAGVAYYTTFSPSVEVAADSCALSTGLGSLYALNLEFGTNIFNWRKLDIGDRVPDTPTLVVPHSDDGHNVMKFIGVGIGDGTGTITLCDGFGCNEPIQGISLETMRTYMFIKEHH